MSKPGPTLPFRVVPPPASPDSAVVAGSPAASSSSPPQPARPSPSTRSRSGSRILLRVTGSPFEFVCRGSYAARRGAVRSEPPDAAEAPVEEEAHNGDQEQHGGVAEPPAELGHVVE